MDPKLNMASSELLVPAARPQNIQGDNQPFVENLRQIPMAQRDKQRNRYFQILSHSYLA
jgi:hypothetical protein